MTHLQLKPNPWSCAITSLAMVLQRPVEQLIEEIGHDGSEIIFPGLDEPMQRRGFHSQELIHLAWQHGFSVTAFELFPAIVPTSGGSVSVPVYFGQARGNWERLIDMIHTTQGVLAGRCSPNGVRHAVCYDHGEIFDPDGCQYQYSREECESRGFYGNRALVFIHH